MASSQRPREDASGLRVRAVAALLAVALAASCAPDNSDGDNHRDDAALRDGEDAGNDGSGDGNGKSSKTKHGKSANGQQTDVDAADGGGNGSGAKKTAKPKAKAASHDSGATTPELAIVYPALAFHGGGVSTHEMSKKLPTTMDISTQMSDTQLSITTTKAHVSCGGIDGCKQSDLDGSSKNLLGAMTYGRLQPDAKDALVAKGFQDASFAVFAMTAVSRQGVTFTFDAPLPVFPLPAPEDRYKPLDDGPMEWTAHVTASTDLPNDPKLGKVNPAQVTALEQAGRLRKDFTVTVSISKVAVGGGAATLQFQTTIAEDKGRMLYQRFPVPRLGTYHIDSTTRDVRSIDMTNWYNGEKSHGPEVNVMTYKLCSKTVRDKVSEFACK